MAELTTTTGLNRFVDNNVLNLGEVSPTDKVSFSLPWLAKEEAIEYIDPVCRVCTSAGYEDGKISGVLDIAKTGMTFQPGETVVSKDVLVFLEDGQKRFIPGAKKIKQTNEFKTFIRIRLNAKVVI